MDLTERHTPTYLAFVEAANLLQGVMEDQLRRDAGISYLQFSLLARLAEAPQGAMRMTDLADGAVHSRSGLSYQARQLEEAGLLVRSRSRELGDERAVSAAITDDGREVVRRAMPGHLQVVQESFFGALPEGQLDQLGEVLPALRDHLRDIAPSAAQRRRRPTA